MIRKSKYYKQFTQDEIRVGYNKGYKNEDMYKNEKTQS